MEVMLRDTDPAFDIVPQSAKRGERGDHSVPFAASGGFPMFCIVARDRERRFGFPRRSLKVLHRVPFCGAGSFLAIGAVLRGSYL